MDNNHIHSRYKNVLVIGMTNRRNVYTDNWEESMHRAKLPYRLICTNRNFEGYHEKIKAYLDAIEIEPHNDDTIYIFVNSHDALACSSQYKEHDRVDINKNNRQIENKSTLRRILEQWNEFSRSIVIGTEFFFANGNDISDYWNYHYYWSGQQIPRTNRYLNSGLIAGTRTAILNMFHWVLQDYRYNLNSNKTWCDQSSIARYVNKFPDRVTLDVEYRLFANSIYEWNRNNVSKFNWRNGNLIYIDRQYDETMETIPCFIHTPSRYNDNLYRYNTYGRLMLNSRFYTYTRDYIRPGVISILITIIIVIFFIFLMIYLNGSKKGSINIDNSYQSTILLFLLISILLLVIICSTINPVSS